MTILKEIIANIKNLQGRGEHTDDFKMSDRQLEFIAKHFRSQLAGQRANASTSLDGFYQTLTELKLNRTKDFRPQDSSTVILASDNLPEICSGHSTGDLIKFVGLRDEFTGFQKTEVHLFNIDLENPYVRNLYFTHNGKLYIVTKNRSFIREVLMEAVFTDPREVMKFEGTPIDPFDEFNIDFAIPSGMLGQLNSLIMNNEYRWTLIAPTDNINDGKDSKQ